MCSVARDMTGRIYCIRAETLSGWILCLAIFLPKFKDRT